MNTKNVCKFLTSVKSGVESPIHSSNCADIELLEQLVDAGYVKAVKHQPLAGDIKYFNAKLTFEGEQYLQRLSEASSSKVQTDSSVWTFDRRIQIYGAFIALIGLGIATATYLQ